jgi:hypothetical protein
MIDENQIIDLQAFSVIDQRRLLSALSRAIDEETAHMEREPCSDEWPRRRARLLVLCRLMGMIREMNNSGRSSRSPGPGRRTSRTV